MIRSPSRGRPAPEAGEVAAQKAYAEKHHTLLSGRGGAGNQRSPSRDPLDRARAREAEKHEKELRAAAIQHDEHNPHGTGRGGAGNVTREHSADARGRENGGVGAVSHDEAFFAQRPSSPEAAYRFYHSNPNRRFAVSPDHALVTLATRLDTPMLLQSLVWRLSTRQPAPTLKARNTIISKASLASLPRTCLVTTRNDVLSRRRAFSLI